MANSRMDELKQELDRRKSLQAELQSRNQFIQPNENISPSQGNIFQFRPRPENKLADIVPGMRDPKQIEKAAIGAAGLIGSAFVPEIPAIMEGAGMLPGAVNVLSRMGAGGTFGAMSDPDHPYFGGTVGAAGALVPEAFRLAGRGINALRPSNLFRGTQSPQQLEKSLNITGQTETPLGDVVQSPFLKGLYENVIAKVPFSGANEAMMRTGRNIVERGEGLMKELLGKHSPVNVEGELTDTLIKANKYHRNLKNKLYEEPDKIAKDINLKLELPNFSGLAKQFGNAIEETNILKTEPEFKALMNKMKGYQSPVEQTEGKIISTEGKPLSVDKKYPTLKEANVLSSHLDDIAERYAASPNVSDRNASNVFKRLSKALKEDIRTGINRTGDKELMSSFNKAEKNYAENYSRFLEKEVHQFASGRGDPDMIVQAFIKTGKATDRANLLNKFVSTLPESKRKLLGYAFLKRAINNKGEFDPLAFNQLISTKNLGQRQFDLLFPGKLGQKIKEYGQLVEKNPEAFQLMKNPKTGARLSEFAALGGLFAAPITTSMGILSSRALNKLMTSPRVRESLVNKMLQK